MRTSHYAAPLLGFVVAFGISTSLQAQISLSTVNPSAVSANSENEYRSPFANVNEVNSLPFTTPTVQRSGRSISEVYSNLNSSGLSFCFSESSRDRGFYMDGDGNVYFTAAPGTQYTISGNMAVTGSDYQANIEAWLYDVTSNTTLYYYNNGSYYFPEEESIGLETPTDLTLDDSQTGSLTGTLNATDQYEFIADENMTNELDPQLTGAIDISFASADPVPLPSSAEAGLVLLGLVAATGTIWRRVRRPA
jgi:hypothetical protein